MPNGETSKNIHLTNKSQLPIDINDPLDDMFLRHDPNRADRSNIAAIIQGLLGDDPAYDRSDHSTRRKHDGDRGCARTDPSGCRDHRGTTRQFDLHAEERSHRQSGRQDRN